MYYSKSNVTWNNETYYYSQATLQISDTDHACLQSMHTNARVQEVYCVERTVKPRGI